ncbi:hypothetical protein [uncultured Dokdonia sp.]|uniref:hypothetical protein n=1 Tax=uncultured Dokdonia sp. TaxID=575653 RepID=UPI0026132DC4|nr:hypothetical protein [uncultured Dokdonia sp.]
MILKKFYLDKKERIETEMSYSGFMPTIALYTKTAFKNSVKTPTVLFKYNAVNWKTSSEENHIAEVSFSLFIVLPIEDNKANLKQHECVFDFSKSVDKAILSSNKRLRGVDESSSEMLTFKVEEKQCPNHMQDSDNNVNHFVWELTYTTTLVENNDKNFYSLIHKIPVENQNHTRVEHFSGPFISLEDQEMYEIINTSFNNN